MLLTDRDFKLVFKMTDFCLLGMLDSVGFVYQILEGEVVLKERADQEWLGLAPTAETRVPLLYKLLEFLILSVKFFLSSSLSEEDSQEIFVKGQRYFMRLFDSFQFIQQFLNDVA